MPTGYTAGIADGMTFEQYALGCARAFGALVMMRDEPTDAPIPDKFAPSTYYTDRVASLQAELARLNALSDAEAEREAEAAFMKATTDRKTCIAEADALRAKYEAMLAQVDAYEAPTPDHVEFKAFMASQIRESIRGDCGTSFYAEPERLTGAAWKAQMIALRRRSLAYSIEQAAKERERTDQRNAWIAALSASLRPKVGA